jgi:hypothetical protein
VLLNWQSAVEKLLGKTRHRLLSFDLVDAEELRVSSGRMLRG